MTFWRRGGKSDEMPFLEHLEELRWRIIWSLLALVAGALAGFFLVTHFDVLGLLIRPVRPFLQGGKLKYLGPADPFFVTLHLAVITGLLLAFPIVAYQIWSFVSPALLPAEKRAILPALYFGLLLFAGGMALAYFGVLPIALRFFSGFQQADLEQNITIDAYLALVLKLLLGFGLVFETPVVMLVLAALGIVTSSMLRRTRPFAIVIIFVVAALLTPPDVFSQMLMALPLLVLYELSIWIVKITERRRAASIAAAGDDEPIEPSGTA